MQSTRKIVADVSQCGPENFNIDESHPRSRGKIINQGIDEAEVISAIPGKVFQKILKLEARQRCLGMPTLLKSDPEG